MGTLTNVHGVSSHELPTLILATVTADSAVNFVTGAAPVHRVPGVYTQKLNGSGSGASVTTTVTVYNSALVSPTNPTGSPVNVPVLCQSIQDFITAFTYDDTNFGTYGLCQHAY